MQRGSGEAACAHPVLLGLENLPRVPAQNFTFSNGRASQPRGLRSRRAWGEKFGL